MMKQHPVISDYILAEHRCPSHRPPDRPLEPRARRTGGATRTGSRATMIPQPARIVLVADAFDALTTNRVYRPGRTAALALEEIRAHVGTQFCARVVEQLEALHREEPEALAIEEELAGVA